MFLKKQVWLYNGECFSRGKGFYGIIDFGNRVRLIVGYCLMAEDLIRKHKIRFRIYNIICIILSILFTLALYFFVEGWGRGDGSDASFGLTAALVFLGIAVISYITLVLPGFIIHKILMWRDK